MTNHENPEHTDDVIASEAVGWLNRLETASAAERQEFVEWVRRSSRHYMAFWYLQSITGETGQTPPREPAAFQQWLATCFNEPVGSQGILAGGSKTREAERYARICEDLDSLAQPLGHYDIEAGQDLKYLAGCLQMTQPVFACHGEGGQGKSALVARLFSEYFVPHHDQRRRNFETMLKVLSEWFVRGDTHSVVTPATGDHDPMLPVNCYGRHSNGSFRFNRPVDSVSADATVWIVSGNISTWDAKARVIARRAAVECKPSVAIVILSGPDTDATSWPDIRAEVKKYKVYLDVCSREAGLVEEQTPHLLSLHTPRIKHDPSAAGAVDLQIWLDDMANIHLDTLRQRRVRRVRQYVASLTDYMRLAVSERTRTRCQIEDAFVTFVERFCARVLWISQQFIGGVRDSAQLATALNAHCEEQLWMLADRLSVLGVSEESNALVWRELQDCVSTFTSRLTIETQGSDRDERGKAHRSLPVAEVGQEAARLVSNTAASAMNRLLQSLPFDAVDGPAQLERADPRGLELINGLRNVQERLALLECSVGDE